MSTVHSVRQMQIAAAAMSALMLHSDDCVCVQPWSPFVYHFCCKPAADMQYFVLNVTSATSPCESIVMPMLQYVMFLHGMSVKG